MQECVLFTALIHSPVQVPKDRKESKAIYLFLVKLMKPVCSFLFILRDIFQRKSPSLVKRFKNGKKKNKKELQENPGIWFYPSAREELPLTEGYKSQGTLSLTAEVLNTENWNLRIWDFRLGIGCYLRQNKLYRLLSVSEHISKISISHWNTVPPSPGPPLADSQSAQTEALTAGKRRASGKPKGNCYILVVKTLFWK